MKLTTIMILAGAVGTADARRKHKRHYKKPCKGKIEAMEKLAEEGGFTESIKFQLSDEGLSRKEKLAQAKDITASMNCDVESTKTIFRYVSASSFLPRDSGKRFSIGPRGTVSLGSSPH